MKNSLTTVFGVLAVSLLIATTVFAGGYQLNEHGARATGMGGAFVARASDPSAIFFNPAGLAFQKGINILAGGTFVLPSTTFTKSATTAAPAYDTQAISNVFFPPNLYGTYAVNDRLVVGVGVFTPYGLGTEWPSDKSWPGRYLAVKTDLKTFYINPSIAYKINDQLSVGVGVSYVLGSVNMGYNVATYSSLAPPTPATTDGSVNLDATANGINFNFGVIYKPMPKLSLGVSYRSQTDLEFSGDAKFTNMQALSPFFPGGSGKATLPMPASIFAGAAYELRPDLTVEADFQYVGWDAYDKLTVELPNGPAFPLTGQPLQKTTTSVKNWDVGYLGRVGAEYKYDDQLTLRAGLIMDISPQPPVKTEPMLPDGDRTDISVGMGYKIDQNWTLDATYMLVLFTTRDTNNPLLKGTYNSLASLIGFNVGYSF